MRPWRRNEERARTSRSGQHRIAPWPAAMPAWPTSAPPALDAWGISDRGRRRSRNEDAFLLRPVDLLPGAVLMAVADGIGGSHGGAEASRLAVDTLLADVAAARLAGDETPAHALRRGMAGASAALQQTSRERRDLRGLGTTLTVALVAWPRLWLAHAGDSRAYLWRGGELRQLTRDHTLAERMREDGLIEPDRHIARWESVLWNSLSGDLPEPEVDERQELLQPGDRLLLCSDGLTRHLDDDELSERLAAATDARCACEEMVRDANLAGGVDNVTVVLARLG